MQLKESKELIIDVDRQTELELSFEARSQGVLSLYIKGSGNLNLTINALNDSDWKVLSINESNESLLVKETVTLHQGAVLHCHYGEMSDGNHKKESMYHFIGAHSSLYLKAAIMSFNHLKWKMTAYHDAKDTFATLDSNSIVLDQGHLNLEVVGQIVKGMGGSKTHQMSRILNLGEKSQCIVFPKLLIDENDVEASHAASVGQPNEDHIYYLQSRGLSRTQALRLIIQGYLTPIIAEVEDEEIKETLTKEIERKVALYV